MSSRPGIKHIVAVEGLTKEEKAGFEKMYEDFYEEPIADSLLPVLGDDEYEKDFVKEIVGDKMVGDILELSRYSDMNFIGMKPIYHLQETEIYNHTVLWSMIEAGVLDMTSQLIAVPYVDLSAHLNKSRQELTKEVSLSQAIELSRYDGEWGRKYKHSELSYYDADLSLTKAYLEKLLGFPLKKEQIQRYVLMEWG